MHLTTYLGCTLKRWPRETKDTILQRSKGRFLAVSPLQDIRSKIGLVRYNRGSCLEALRKDVGQESRGERIPCIRNRSHSRPSGGIRPFRVRVTHYGGNMPQFNLVDAWVFAPYIVSVTLVLAALR